MWNHDEGWGVIDSPETPGGCWAHFSSGAMRGYVAFDPGDPVSLEWEVPGQDGWPFRAVRIWPSGQDPVDRETGSSGAYSSTLTLTFDDPGEPSR
ncbi:hypothetical protein [Actinoplanes utahensis]|uniref:Cold-shock protein n=1 Tax=Actinoplanes utahensis TaxID=1869 RepID=A0A0A6XE18_ACTUT|nr:hypothetical protein [Actinoplanes utahensis]KHD78312.1 hypothetical protein MB27_05590 [Actinoplanes utahensis]GIF28917.1 hypothetical protein Aut01nite_19030 [Actinoplanes utahensis]